MPAAWKYQHSSNINGINIKVEFFRMKNFTCIPVFVASRTASTSLSYLGLKVNVKAQSMILPLNENQR